MSKLIDEAIENEITTGLNYNHITGQQVYSYKLPKFFKNEKGEYVFAGNATISTIKEFKQYKKAYGEVAKQLSVYKKVVGQIYKNALNSLIADDTKYQVGANAYSLSSKLSTETFTANSVRESTPENYGATLSYLTKAAYKTKRLKPSAEINGMMKESYSNAKNRISVLPVMTDNGVVLNQSKTNKSIIEANFKTVSYSAANEIKTYLLTATNNLSEEIAGQVKTQIEKLFKEARQIGELVESGVNENIAERLEKLAVEFSDLIGIDLTHYEKTPTTKKAVKLESAKAETSSTPKKVLETGEILIDGSYKTAPAVEDGRIVTKLTPDGMKFTVQLKNNKLLVKNVEAEQDFDFDTFCK